MKRFLSSLLIFIVLISISVPVLADQDFVVKNSIIESNEDHLSISIATPYFEGFESADKVNAYIRSLIVDSIGEARLNAKLNKQEDEEWIKKGQESMIRDITLDTIYDYSKSGNILSVYLHTYYYSGGAHPINWINSITINTLTGEIYSFKDLFKDSINAAKFIEDKIISKIEENPEPFFAYYRETINDKNGDFNFYFDGDELVVYFGIYDIAPYSSGTSYFVFKADEIKKVLKTEIYDSINMIKSNGSIYLNGNDINSKSTPYIDDNGIIMVPLRAIAEALDYKVDWNKKDGAVVAGGFIKNGVDSYYTTNKKPVNIAKPVVRNGVTFVPIQYFTQVLEENVTYGNDDTIRIFRKDDLGYGFNNLIMEFENPSDLNSAIEMYAKSVKERNGAIQFALMDTDNRMANYSYLNDLNFITGVSSPWIDSYEILPTGYNTFRITFHLKTSDPKDIITMTSDISLVEDGFTFRIKGLINSNY